MKRLIVLLFAFLCLFISAAKAQNQSIGNPSHAPGPPTGSCLAGVIYTDSTNGKVYSCNAGVWALVISSANTHGSGAPVGSCFSGSIYTDDTNGNLYSCDSGVWVLVNNTGVSHGVGAPVGLCSAGSIYTNDTNGSLYSCSGGVWITTNSTNVIHGSGAPIGSCVAGFLYTDDSSGNLFSCNSSTWKTLSGLTPQGSIGNIQISNTGGLFGSGVTNPANVGLVGNIFVKPDNATSVRYAAGTCTGGNACVDTNDGLSWGTAKHSISAALVSLPQGNGTNIIGNGVVYVGPGVVANAAGSVYGVWLMGFTDPNFSSPPTGWLKICTHGTGGCGPSQDTGSISIIGVPNIGGGPNGHMNRVVVTGNSETDINHPGLWLSGGEGFTIQNLVFNGGRAGVIGACSDNTRTNTCDVVGATFINDEWGVQQLSGNGPALDITGYSYWLWFRDCGFSGNAYSAAGGYLSDQAAAILMDGRGNNGQGLVYITDANFAGGGIKNYIGSLNVGSLYVTNAILEGDFVHNIPPLVWLTGGIADGYFFNLNVADPGPAGSYTFRNDAQAGPGPTVINGSGPMVGPAVSINSPNIATTQDPLLLNETGFWNGYMVGQTNAARRIGGLTPVRFANKGDSNTGNWSVPNLTGTLTFTQGVSDPFGGTKAAKASTNSATPSFLQLGGCVSYTPTVGDWIVVGEWERNVLPNNTSFVESCYGYPTVTANVILNRGMMYGDGNWDFLWSAYKVTSSGSPILIGVGNQISNTFTPTIYGPLMYVIPAGTISDSEVIEFASTMNSVDISCPVGSICTLNGHPVQADKFQVRSVAGGFASSITTATLAANRNITIPDPLASAVLPLVTGTITTNQSLCASGTAGVLTSCGINGRGTVISTATACASAASPAVCAAAPSGFVNVAASATTVVVNTTAVTANSQIQLTFDSSLGTALSVTCNTTPVQPTVSARSAGASFTITVPSAPSTNPACFSYTVIN